MTTEVGQEVIASCPPDIRPFLVQILEHGRVLVVVIQADWRIQWVNQAFRDALLEGRPADTLNFCDLLSPISARLMDRLQPPDDRRQQTVELQHQTSTGLRTIKYQFLPCGDGRLAGVGSDRSEEIELIEQMSALIEDLHREIENRTELSTELARMATTDFLTGVSNRREFDEILLDEWNRMKRYQSHFALMIIDLDHFKSVNDKFGHQVGDEVLKKVAKVLKAVVRGEDVVARYGGEEFAIIALGANSKNARDLGERLRQRVLSTPMPCGVWEMTITIGIAATVSLDPEATLVDLIAQADKALYQGKDQGRNQVVVARG